MKNLIKNKKADVPITLLVVMTLALCGVAIITFLYADYKQTNQTLTAGNFAGLYSDDSAFEFYVHQLAEYTLESMNNLKPGEITAEEFVNTFKTNYGKYSELNNFPEVFKSGTIKEQIENSRNYDVQITPDALKFQLKSFNFTRSYNPEKSYGLKDAKITKDISFEIPLKTPAS